MNFYDAHTHLNEEKIFPERRHYLDLFIQAGGKGLVNSGASEFFNIKGIEIAKACHPEQGEGYKLDSSLRSEGQEYVIVKSTVGFHPGECGGEEGASGHGENITSENLEDKMKELRNLYEANKEHIVAIGECGIDIHYPGSSERLELQKKLFAMHCDLAQKLNLPIVVHSRDDFQTTLEILKKYKDLIIYFHCRGYGPEEYEILNSELNHADLRGGTSNGKLFVGFCGNVTYKNAQPLRNTLDKVSLDQLVMETDAPWLSPQIVRGTTNHPANVRYIYEFVAQQRGISLDQLCEIVEKNYKNLYNL